MILCKYLSLLKQSSNHDEQVTNMDFPVHGELNYLFLLFQCHVANMRYQCWFMLEYSQRSYGKFWYYSDFDQSTKLGTLIPYDVLSNFRRGDTWIPLGIPRFCKAARKIKTHYKCHIKCSIYKKYFCL